MSFNAKEVPAGPSKAKKILDVGAYPARLVQLINFGIQPQVPYMGQEKQPTLELSITYEFLDEFMDDEDGNPDGERPLWVSETFSFFSLDVERATSTKRYMALDQSMEHDGDWMQLLGKPCIVNLGKAVTKSGPNTGRERNKVISVSAMRPKEAAKAPELVNNTRVFDFYNPDMEAYEAFPEWIKEKLQGAVDFPGSALEEALGAGGFAVEEKEKPAPNKVAANDEDDW